jgi:hypothetical protein
MGARIAGEATWVGIARGAGSYLVSDTRDPVRVLGPPALCLLRYKKCYRGTENGPYPVRKGFFFELY